MENGISATERHFLECFEVEPQLLDPYVPWFYNDATYEVTVERFTISFAVAAASRDVRIVVWHENRQIFEFQAMGVRDLHIVDDYRVDAVDIDVDERSRLRLQIRPTFEITQAFDAEPRES